MKIKKLAELEEKKWSGGITRELYRDDWDFNIRISCAEINPGRSSFTDYTGYKRILRILENEVTLYRGDEKIELFEDRSFYFEGKDRIISETKQKAIDFNVIFNENKVKVIYKEVNGFAVKNLKNKSLIFSLKDGNKVDDIVLNKFDYLIVEDKELELEGSFVLVNWEFKE